MVLRDSTFSCHLLSWNVLISCFMVGQSVGFEFVCGIECALGFLFEVVFKQIKFLIRL